MEPTLSDYEEIFSMIQRGYTSGKFHNEVNFKEYDVYWEITTTAEEDQTRININKWSE